MMVFLSPFDFDEKSVPIDYCWSGYVQDSSEFKNHNFLKVINGEVSSYVCSAENGVALGEYLSKYIIKHNCIWDLEAVSAPGINFWFYKAWEQAEPSYGDLPEWVHNLVEFFISEKLIARIDCNDNEYFTFSNLVSFESQDLPSAIQSHVLNICRTSLIKFCDNHFSDYGSTEELTEFDVSNWAESLIKEYIETHPAYGGRQRPLVRN